MKRALGVSLLVVLQVVIAAEITLQILGLVLPRTSWGSRAVDLSATEDATTILSVGDSHTFGAPLPPAESYPSQLEKLLNARGKEPYRVVNLGIPGMNTALMANRFEDNLRRYRPDLVILWGGVNNVWNESETEGWGEDEGALDWLYRGLLRLKLVRLVRFLGSDANPTNPGRAKLLKWERGRSTTWRQGDELLHFEGTPGASVPRERAKRGAHQDLTRMVRLAQAYGIPIFLVTYPYPVFDWINVETRDVARELGVEVLETAEDRERAKADGYSDEELIVMAAGPHPRGTLYGYIASSMVPIVLRLLDEP